MTYYQRYRLKNLAKIRAKDRARAKARRQKDPEAFRAKKRAEYARRKQDPTWVEKTRARVNKYYVAHIDEERARHRVKQARKRALEGDHVRALARKWYRANAKRVITLVALYKKRTRLTEADWVKVEEAYRASPHRRAP